MSEDDEEEEISGPDQLMQELSEKVDDCMCLV